MILYIVFQLVSVLGLYSAVEVCPDGYIKHETSCYKFHHQHLSWPESITFCKALGSHLVQIESESEHNYLIQRIKEVVGSFDIKDFWIDLSDAVEQGTWMWTRTGQKATYLKWGGGNPNYYPREDCGGLYHAGNYYFGDWTCDTKLLQICEIELDVNPSVIG